LIAPDFAFDPETHIGTYKGVVWPSVTQLLQEFGLIDYTGVPPQVLDRKRVLGTRVHAATELLDECNLDEEHFNASFPECVPYLEAYRKFRVMDKFDAERKPGRLWSLKWKFHGEPDEHGIHIATRNGRRVLIDYKCTFKMFKSTGAQLAAYAILLDECLKIKIQDRYGLLLKPTGGYDLCPFRDPVDRTDFLYALHLHWQKRNKYQTTQGVSQYVAT
jgi:hypothetical protein